jgi:hypothetical protein
MIKNGQSAMLRWSSSAGVTRAILSDGIGSVAANGYLQVTPESSRNYVLTVYGQGTSASCNVSISVSANAPYVSLSQIPYTGFDFGSTGNAIYWTMLVAFAIAGAYLVTYNMPSFGFRFAAPSIRMPRVALPAMPKRMVAKTMIRRAAPAPVVRANTARVPQIAGIPSAMGITSAPIRRAAPVAHATATHAPVHTARVALPVAEHVRTTTDSMNILHSKAGEMPRIVISRA